MAQRTNQEQVKMAQGNGAAPAAATGKKKSAGRPAVDPNETPAQRAVRLAKQRVPRTLKAISGVGKLAGRGYELSPAQKAKIVKDLKSAVERVENAFAGAEAATAGEYEI